MTSESFIGNLARPVLTEAGARTSSAQFALTSSLRLPAVCRSAVEQQQPVKLVFALFGAQNHRAQNQRMLGPKNRGGEPLISAVNNSESPFLPFPGYPAGLTKVPGQNQSDSPAERVEDAFVFSEHGIPDPYGKIDRPALVVLGQEFTRD